MSTILSFDNLDDPVERDEGCAGLYFRYTERNYSTGSKFVFSKQIALLKRMSCPGCPTCCWMLEDLRMGVEDFGEEFFEFSPNLKHGDLVELEYVIDSKDWETGYVDYYHWKVNKSK